MVIISLNRINWFVCNKDIKCFPWDKGRILIFSIKFVFQNIYLIELLLLPLYKKGLKPVSLQQNLKRRKKETNMSALKSKTSIHNYLDNNGYYVYYTNLHIFLAGATFHRNT